MNRQPFLWTLTLTIIVQPQLSFAQSRPSPIYSLPADGAWVEFEWWQKKKEGVDKGTLRISSVGRETRLKQDFRWIELKLTPGDASRTRLRKVLINEKAVPETLFEPGSITEFWEREASDKQAKKNAVERAAGFLAMGIPLDAKLRLIDEKEMLTTKVGVLPTRHVTTELPNQQSDRVYHGWLTNEVPFGCARFQIHERDASANLRLVFEAKVIRTGKDATSRLP